LQGNVREWTRRVAEITFLLQPLSAAEREAATVRLIEQPRRFARSPGGVGARRRPQGPPPRGELVPAVQGEGVEVVLADHLRTPSGRVPGVSPSRPNSFSSRCRCHRTSSRRSSSSCRRRSAPPTRFRSSRPRTRPSGPFRFPTPFFDPRDATGLRLFDISGGFPDGDSAVFRIGHLPRGAPLSRNLFFNLALLVVLLVIALYVTGTQHHAAAFEVGQCR